MTEDEMKWLCVALWIVAFVLALPAILGGVDAWLYAMRLPQIWSWDMPQKMGALTCALGGWCVGGIGWVMWPRR